MKSADPPVDFIQGITLGQEQSKWESQVTQLINSGILKPYVSTGGVHYNRFQWPLKDTIVTIDVEFNGGGQNSSGPLKELYIELGTEKAKDISPEDERGFRPSGKGYVIPTKFCSVQKFARIKQYLDEKYGRPDSTFVPKNKETNFYYRKASYLIRLRNSYYAEPGEGVPVPYYTNAKLNITLNGKLP